MKKTILLIVLAGFFCLHRVHAQSGSNGPKLGLGADFSLYLPSNKNMGNYSGIGGSLLYQHPLVNRLNVTLNAGYLKFNGKEIYVGIKSYEKYIPVKAGLRYFFTELVYCFAEAGAAISTANGSGSGTAFAYSPGIGTEIAVGRDHSIDIGLRYEAWTRSNGTRSFAGLRAGFNF